MTALLGTPVHQTVLADVEISGASAAMPFVGATNGQIFLKPVVVCEVERRLPKAYRLFEYRLLFLVEQTQMAGPIVNDADGCGEPELVRAVCDCQRVGRLPDPTADDGVDGHVELGIRGEPTQLLVEDLEALLRDVVRNDVVDADLKMVEPGAIEPFDPRTA